MSDGRQVRIGTEERKQAVSALTDHHAAGRLDAEKYEDRRGRAGDAVTRRDLDALFTDLPGDEPAFGVASVTTSSGSEPGPTNRDERRAQRRSERSNGLRGGRKNVRTGLVVLSPFMALVLFFLTGSWLWFLLVPAIGIICGVFGQDDD